MEERERERTYATETGRGEGRRETGGMKCVLIKG